MQAIQPPIMRTSAPANGEILAICHLRDFLVGVISRAREIPGVAQKRIEIGMQDVAKFEFFIADILVTGTDFAVRFNGEVLPHAVTR